jgi:hypothetical protein
LPVLRKEDSPAGARQTGTGTFCGAGRERCCQDLLQLSVQRGTVQSRYRLRDYRRQADLLGGNFS